MTALVHKLFGGPYLVYDLETQPNVHMKRKASPWHPDNYIVAAGWKKQGDSCCSYQYNPEFCKYNLEIDEDVKVIVGFNLKFDLLWQWDNPELKAFLKRGGVIWDCQYAEYLLHGQDPKYHYNRLTEVAPNYGGTEKIDEVAILWDAGVQTSAINKDLLIDYLVGTVEEGRDAGDVGNTEKIFLGQIKKAEELGLTLSIQQRMEGLLGLTEMEWNGIYVDTGEARKQLLELTAERASKFEELQDYVPELPPEFEFNWGSGNQKSALIFGGAVKYKKKTTYIDTKTGKLARFRTDEAHWLLDDDSTAPITDADNPPSNVQRFKSGKKAGDPKTKKVKGWGELKERYEDFIFDFKGYTKPLEQFTTKKTDARGNPIYSVSGEVIDIIEQSGVPFCKALARYEALQKEINTYFIGTDSKGNLTGMLTCVDPRDKIIHHSLNNVATVTARLSSSNPNLQNAPRKDKSNMKRMFSSRFGKDGRMMEVDYSQLEIVVQGLLTKDAQLIKDLINGIDFHCKRVGMQHKVSYDYVKKICSNEDHPDHNLWKVRRTAAKIFSFQRAYGAGATLIAAQTGLSVEEVKRLIEQDEATYPAIVEFNADVEEAVKNDCKTFRDPERNFQVFRRGTYQAPTGCLYTFRSYPAQDWQREKGIVESFSPTEMKNYPIQGTGGEIVQGITGRLFRHFLSSDNYCGKAFICNTVHDCVWVDAHADVADIVAADVKRIMESVPDWLAQFGIDSPVPFPVEVEVGLNMLDLKHIL